MTEMIGRKINNSIANAVGRKNQKNVRCFTAIYPMITMNSDTSEESVFSSLAFLQDKTFNSSNGVNTVVSNHNIA